MKKHRADNIAYTLGAIGLILTCIILTWAGMGLWIMFLLNWGHSVDTQIPAINFKGSFYLAILISPIIGLQLAERS